MNIASNIHALHGAPDDRPAPLVSVVMPVYNGAPHVRRAIDSVLAQTLESLELIIIDDASTDDTVAAVLASPDPRIRLLRNAANCGPAHSRNIGMAASAGTWIALIDADDWYSPDRLALLHARAQDCGADAVVDDLFIIDDGQAQPRSTLFIEAGCGVADGGWLKVTDMIEHEIGALKPVFRRVLFDACGHRYDPGLRYGEDYLLYLDWLLDGARMLVVRTPRYYLRRGDTGSLTTCRVAMAGSSLALQRRLLCDRRLDASPGARQALLRRIGRTRDLLVFYQVICPWRSGQFSAGWRALLRSPHFLAALLRRLPRMLALRLHRLAYRMRRGRAPVSAGTAPAREDAA